MRRKDEVDRRPWGLILGLVVALAVGAIGLPLQFLTYRQLGETPKTEQLRNGQQALCQQINDVARQAGLKETDCSKINSVK